MQKLCLFEALQNIILHSLEKVRRRSDFLEILFYQKYS